MINVDSKEKQTNESIYIYIYIIKHLRQKLVYIYIVRLLFADWIFPMLILMSLYGIR